MISLTFGEQVKIVLSRKGMTIKELAEQIEERTGKKMSRQNLTQRLGRDNFQEQDMRMIAEILGCSFQLSILATQEAAERASVIEEVLPTTGELDRLEARKERKAARAEAKKREAEERDLTVGEIVDMLQEEQSESAGQYTEAKSETEAAVNDAAEMHVEKEEEQAAEGVQQYEETVSDPAEIGRESTEVPQMEEEQVEALQSEGEQIAAEQIEQEQIAAEETLQEQSEPVEEIIAAEPERVVSEPVSAKTVQEKKGGFWSRWEKPKKKEERSDFQPIRRRADEDEDREKGDVNPYTGREYQSNSVRMHPKRIGYVQVYDRKEHKWTDMTEWAFLGFEERKKAAMGKDYEPPIYLD